MFVDNNKVSALLPYYSEKLKEIYPQNEIDSLFYFMCYFKFKLEKHAVKYSDIRLSESELLEQRQIVKRLQNEEPIQHIMERTEFYGLQFKVNHHTLVPRPETEELVDLILKTHSNEPHLILDIGTGSGCIPIALLHNRSNWIGYAYDLSDEALKTAQYNANLNQIPPSILTFEHQDILNFDVNDCPPVDLMISNPPYVLESDKAEMSDNVLKYDPHMALFVPDQDPLRFYIAIVKLANSRLKPNGKIYFEIHEKYGQDVANLLAENGYKSINIQADLQGKDRIVSAIK